MVPDDTEEARGLFQWALKVGTLLVGWDPTPIPIKPGVSHPEDPNDWGWMAGPVTLRLFWGSRTIDVSTLLAQVEIEGQSPYGYLTPQHNYITLPSASVIWFKKNRRKGFLDKPVFSENHDRLAMYCRTFLGATTQFNAMPERPLGQPFR